MTDSGIINSSVRQDTGRWLIFGLLSSLYFFSYFHRVSTSVIAPDILIAFKTNATALGFMSSMYFYLYAIEQPLVGYLSDMLGPKRVVGLWSMIATLGSVIFGLSPTIEWAAIGRGLIGIGMGGVYVPALKALSRHFSKRKFAGITGLLLASGNLGAIVATTPLAWMVGLIGLRSGFLVIGGITLVLALAVLVLIQERSATSDTEQKKHALHEEKSTSTSKSAVQILTSPRFWILAVIFFGIFGCTITFQGLWAASFLMSIYKIDQLHASGLNMLIPLGFILGAPLCGRLEDKFFRNKVHVLILLLAIQILVWAGIALGGHVLGKMGMIILLLAMGGITGGLATTLWSLVREITPGAILGLTLGCLNLSPLLGMAILQGLTGAIMDHVGRVNGVYPLAAYRSAFMVCLLIIASCFILGGCFRKHLYVKT